MRWHLRNSLLPSGTRLISMRIPLSLAVLAGIMCGGSAISAQCRAADAQTANMIRYMRQLATAAVPADSESVGIRTAYRLPAVVANQVSLVTTKKTCQSALAAFKTAVSQLMPSPTNIYVVAVGSVYVVWASRPASTEWTQHIVLNSKFKVLSQFAG